MGAKTNIEWTDASWNPTTGCTKISAGCDNCYAETLAERFRGTPGHYYENGFDVQLRPAKLDLPLRWTKPKRIFVNSMSDLFHKDIPEEYVARVFAVMALAEKHTFQLLTKRHGRMRSLINDRTFQSSVQREANDLLDGGVKYPQGWDPEGHPFEWPLPNVWLGVSAEDQARADLRLPALLDTSAVVRFLSMEPLLGPVDLHPWLAPDEFGRRVDWVIVGGESGHGSRPMRPEWATSLRDQCVEAEVPFLFKQAGVVLAKEWGCKDKKGADSSEWPEQFAREYPEVTHA